jgi:predicted ester cyclase
MSFNDIQNRASHHPAKPLARTHMPTDLSIALHPYTNGRSVRIPAEFGPKQSMAGFDPEYSNIVDYIVRITHRIWETGKDGVEYIADTYAPDSLVFDDYGLQRGNAKIIGDTHHTTDAFPDIILDADEMIWAGDDKIGFHTSHRVRIIGTNTGPSSYGPATNARIDVPCAANCVVKANDIYLEHVLYNTSAMIQQLGLDLWDEAARLSKTPPSGWPRTPEVWAALRTGVAPERPISETEPVTGFDPDAFARRVHLSVWNDDKAAIDTDYAEDVKFEGTTNRRFNGRTAYGDYVSKIRAAFPDLELQVDEVYWMGNEIDGWLISTRWSADGTHTGGDLYRTPTQRPCQIWGITEWQVKDDKIVNEFQIFNELDLMMQIEKVRV